MHLKGIKERRMQIIFGVMILATVPCYLLGFGLLRVGRGDNDPAPAPTQTASPIHTATRRILQRTRFPTFTPSPSPSATSSPTASPRPSATPEPSSTATSLPTSTAALQPTETETPEVTASLTESPTQEDIQAPD